jgi:lipoprotein Spr
LLASFNEKVYLATYLDIDICDLSPVKRLTMLKKLVSFLLLNSLLFALLFVSKEGHAQYETYTRPAAEVPLNKDPEFLSKYSGILGVDLDSTCNPAFITEVSSWLGTPYRHGGCSHAGTDCSGFVATIYKNVYDVDMTHSASAMIFEMKQIVKKSELQEGDIIFFRVHGRRISHVGIYLKDYKFIHAALSGVAVGDLRDPYYTRAYYTAGRPISKGGNS